MAVSTVLRNNNFSRFYRLFSTSVPLSNEHYNIIIAGGGMVGTAAACAIAKNPKLGHKSVLLLEGAPKKDIPARKGNDNYSNRVVSINPSSRKFFESIGVWNIIENNRYATVKKMQVWDANSEAAITFDYPGFADDISYIIENDVILHSLNSVLKDNGERTTVNYNSKIQQVNLNTTGKPTTVTLADDSSISCDLLIGAEGVTSSTRQAIGGQYLTWNYKQKGLVATLKLSETTENVVAWQRFLPNGPIALLPLTNELSSLVWTTTVEEAERLCQVPEDVFVDAVNDALWKQMNVNPIVKSVDGCLRDLLDKLSLSTREIQQLPPSIKDVVPGSRASFPLGFGHATRYVAPGAALVGDAAHRVHPLAGLGVNLGFADVESLVDILAEAVYSGEKLGCSSSLSKYQQQQQLHNFPIMTTIDVIQKMYNTEAAPVVMVRSVVMQLMNTLTPLKKVMMQQASS